MENLRSQLSAALKALPVDQCMEYGPFAVSLSQAAGVDLSEYEAEAQQMIIYAAVDQIMIDPLENFGVLVVARAPDSHLDVNILGAVSVTLTEFGEKMLEAV